VVDSEGARDARCQLLQLRQAGEDGHARRDAQVALVRVPVGLELLLDANVVRDIALDARCKRQAAGKEDDEACNLLDELRRPCCSRNAQSQRSRRRQSLGGWSTRDDTHSAG
jgi:hypothetical protein